MFDNKEEVFRYVEENELQAIQKAQAILKYNGMPHIHNSFNGIIGGKNRTYNTPPEKYEAAEQYVDAWLKAHHNEYIKDGRYAKEKSSGRIQCLLEDEYVSSVIQNYLARIYYNKNSNKG